MTNLISILIPFKNTATYLNACLDSIRNQSYTNWEVIAIDDNSTDNSYDIVKSYLKKDNRFKVYKTTGQGIIDALKLAYAKSKGNFITRMDSDDIMYSSKLHVLHANLTKHGTGHVATGLVTYFAENGINEGYKKYETWLNNLTKLGDNYSEIYKECVIPSPSWMVYRSDFEKVNAFNSNRYPEDYDLTFRFYKHHLKCIACNEHIHYWRDYATRASRTDDNYAKNHFISLKLDYFIELDFNPNRPLVIWGAGTKGKLIAKTLIAKKIEFDWICDNPNKIGKDIYGKLMCDFNKLKLLNNPQSIISVANSDAQKHIQKQLEQLQMKSAQDYFMFC